MKTNPQGVWVTTKPTLSGAALILRDAEPRDVIDRLALAFDPAIVHMFGIDPDAVEKIPALSALTVASVEQWLKSITERQHSWIVEHEGRLLGDVHLNANAVDKVATRAELAISFYDTAKLGLGLGREAIRLVLEMDRFGECEVVVRRSIQSPSGTKALVVFQRECNATVPFNTQISVASSQGRFSPQRTPPFFVMLGNADVSVRWTKDDVVEVDSRTGATIRKQESNAGETRIEYK